MRRLAVTTGDIAGDGKRRALRSADRVVAGEQAADLTVRQGEPYEPRRAARSAR